MSFVDAQLVTDPGTLLDQGIDQINTTLEANGYPGWTANDASLAVIILGAVAQIAADDANVAATVWPAIFRAYGTQLAGIQYQQGATSAVLSTWTFTAPAPAGGYTIPAGSTVIVSGSAFNTQQDYTSAQGDTSAVILLVAAAVGSAYNNLGGVNQPAQLNQQIDWVASIVTQGISSAGADQESDDDYQSKLASTLTLQRLSIVNASDYPPALMSDVCAQATGVVVGRATAIDEYYPAARALSTGGAGESIEACSLTSGSPAVTFQTPLTAQAPEIGAAVSGTGVVAGAVVAAVPEPTSTGFTLSAAATATGVESLTIAALTGRGPTRLSCTASFASGASALTIVSVPYTGAIPVVGAAVNGTGIPAGATVAASPAPTSTGFAIVGGSTSAAETGETVTISAWQNIPRCVTAFVTDVSGNALPTANMDALQAWLASYREVGFLPFVAAPSYSMIYVTVTIHVLPGFSAGAVVANAQAAILSYLSPATWGNPGASSSGATAWLNSGDGYNVLRFNSLIGVVESVPGVAYIPDGGLALGFAASPAATADLAMPGPAPLPQASAETVMVLTDA